MCPVPSGEGSGLPTPLPWAGRPRVRPFMREIGVWGREKSLDILIARATCKFTGRVWHVYGKPDGTVQIVKVREGWDFYVPKPWS